MVSILFKKGVGGGVSGSETLDEVYENSPDNAKVINIDKGPVTLNGNGLVALFLNGTIMKMAPTDDIPEDEPQENQALIYLVSEEDQGSKTVKLCCMLEDRIETIIASMTFGL
jgi:hypothetical protein